MKKRYIFFLLTFTISTAQFAQISNIDLKTKASQSVEGEKVVFEKTNRDTSINKPLGGPPSCFFNSSLVSKTNVLCNGEQTGAYTIKLEGKSPYKYDSNFAPSFPGETYSRTSLRSGFYGVAIWDADECYSFIYISITEPPLLTIELVNSNYNGEGEICTGASDGEITAMVAGGTSTYNYVWSNEATENNTTSLNSVINNLVGGEYSCVVTDANGCSANASKILTEGICLAATLKTETAIAINSTSATLGGNVILDGGSAVVERGIVWGIATEPTVLNNKIAIGEGDGVFSQTIMGLPSKTEIFYRSYAINFMGVAYGNEISFNTKSPNNAPIGIVLSSSLVDENIEEGSIIGILSSTDVDEGDFFLYNLVEGQGDNDNNLFNITEDELRLISSPDFETKSSYTIRISTTDSEGLNYEEAFVVTVNDLSEELTKVQQNQTKENQISLYPNPSKGLVTITSAIQGVSSIHVINSEGRTVQKIENAAIVNGLEIDLSNESKGLYMIQVINVDGVTTEKVILN